MNMKKMNLGILAVAVLAFVSVLAFNRGDDTTTTGESNPPVNEQPVVAENESPKPTENQTPSDTPVGAKALLSVPFVAQAPNANWDDPRQQDGCEEASLVMAYAWATGATSINKNDAEKTIIAMSEFEKEEYGNYLDLNAQDTAKLMKDYYNYSKTRVDLNITMDDIKRELSAGNLVIVPANGKKLNNPNFSSGGPVTHMLIIKGYDDAKQQVITNDPGTRNGNGYVYSYTTIFNAMVNYPSGYHEDQTGQPKAMIVVMK
ncbi:MAG: C39 family peptidase [Candidatus Saccharibacteria bacterium]|nr:C39 family peptidase [Candidatus Saccharibacteria bacterium]